MGVAEYAPVRVHRRLEQSLRLGVLGLALERLRQIARSRERVGMLLSQHPPHHTKHLPLDPLRLRMLPLARE